MDGQRFVRSEPTEQKVDPLENLYEGIGRALAIVRDEFDDKLAELKSRVAERQEKYEAQLIELQPSILNKLNG
jgi:hypothetical protein